MKQFQFAKQASSREICGGWSGPGTAFCPRSSDFCLRIIIQTLTVNILFTYHRLYITITTDSIVKRKNSLTLFRKGRANVIRQLRQIGFDLSYNLLTPTGYVMHQQLYALPTLYLCVLYLSENKQRLVPLTA